MDVDDDAQLAAARFSLQEVVAEVTEFITRKLILATSAAVIRYEFVLLEKDGEKDTVKKAVPYGNDWKFEFDYDQTMSLVSVAAYLKRIAELSGGSQAYETMHEWATAHKQGTPTIFDVFIMPMLVPRSVAKLPWTHEQEFGQEEEDEEEEQLIFATNARPVFDFMAREGCSFLVQFILSSIWDNRQRIDDRHEGKVRTELIVTTPSAVKFQYDRLGAVFYDLAPFQTGIPHLLSPETLELVYAARPRTERTIIDRVYIRWLKVYFGTEMPFCSVEQERRNWVASSMINFSPDNGDLTLPDFRSFIYFDLIHDTFITFAIPEFDIRALYIARNLLRRKYGSMVLSALGDMSRSSPTANAGALKYLIGSTWQAALEKAIAENDTYIEDALEILGNKPDKSDLNWALKDFTPFQRDAAVKILHHHGIHVPHNKYGDIAVVARLASKGVVPSTKVIGKWPAETRQWYDEHVVHSQRASTSDAVDEMFRPM